MMSFWVWWRRLGIATHTHTALHIDRPTANSRLMGSICVASVFVHCVVLCIAMCFVCCRRMLPSSFNDAAIFKYYAIRLTCFGLRYFFFSFLLAVPYRWSPGVFGFGSILIMMMWLGQLFNNILILRTIKCAICLCSQYGQMVIL